MSGDRKHPPSILGLCNPLLDITAYVEKDILEKYNLKANNVILAGDEHKDLCKDLVKSYKVEYTAGGSAQNVMRVVAGILRRQNVQSKVLFSGCISSDDFGDMMEKKANEDGVITNYAICDSVPTGTCAVCLTDQGKNRSLCAFLGASQKFNSKHLRDHWDELVANTDIIYISGFLLAVTPETYHLLGQHIADSSDKKKRFCLNLSAPYISSVFGGELEKVIKYVDILFGNDDEALAFSELMKWDTTNVEEIATKLTEFEKTRKEVGRIVVITQGERPIIVAEHVNNKVEIKKFPCKPIPDSEMVDTNGAGDSFAGGFLSQFMQGATLEVCVEIGSYAAREIIKMSGITLPDFANIPASRA